MAYYRKRAKGWRAEIEKLGERDSETFPTKAQAVAWATRREAEIADGARGKLPLKYVTDALTKYAAEVSPKKKGERWEVLRLNKMGRADGLPFRNKIIHEVTPTDIAEWRDARLKTAKPSTFNREWNLLHNVFQIARREWLWLRELPFKDVQRPRNPNARVRRVAPAEHEALNKALGYVDGQQIRLKKHEVAIAFEFAIESGMRLSEICQLPEANIIGRVAHLPKTKNYDAREVPLTKRAVELVDRMRVARVARQLRGELADTLFSVKPGTLDSLYRVAREHAAKDVPSIATLHFHDTRHEACTRLASKLTVMELARVIGHRDLKSLMIYYNPTTDELANKLD